MCRYEHGSMPLAVYFISKGIAAHVAVPTKVRTALAWLIVTADGVQPQVRYFFPPSAFDISCNQIVSLFVAITAASVDASGAMNSVASLLSSLSKVLRQGRIRATLKVSAQTYLVVEKLKSNRHISPSCFICKRLVDTTGNGPSQHFSDSSSAEKEKSVGFCSCVVSAHLVKFCAIRCASDMCVHPKGQAHHSCAQTSETAKIVFHVCFMWFSFVFGPNDALN